MGRILVRILWLKSDYILPPDTGGKIRTYNLMRELRRICDVTYLCFKSTQTQEDEADVGTCASRLIPVHRLEERKEGVAFYGRVLRGIASRQPYVVQKYRSEELVALERDFVEKTQSAGDESVVILCDFLEMAENVAWDLPVPKVLFQHNVESDIWHQYYMNERNPVKRLYWDFERRRMARYESATCNRFDRVFAVSHEDKATFRQQLGVDRPVTVLPTGVDTEYFAPRATPRTVPGRLVFLGSLDWMPNIDGVLWFLREILPLIRAEHPTASLDIVGRRPVEAIPRAARENDGVRVFADVPDVRPHVAEADLFAVPLRIGGGTRIKIYEAMAMAKGVVSTALGAQGLGLTAGQHIAIGDRPAEFAAAVNRLLRDQGEKAALADAGHRFVHDHCQWKHAAALLHETCLDLSQAYTRERASGRGQ